MGVTDCQRHERRSVAIYDCDRWRASRLSLRLGMRTWLAYRESIGTIALPVNRERIEARSMDRVPVEY